MKTTTKTRCFPAYRDGNGTLHALTPGTMQRAGVVFNYLAPPDFFTAIRAEDGIEVFFHKSQYARKEFAND